MTKQTKGRKSKKSASAELSINAGDYDLVVVSQPWRARVGAEFKVEKVLSPLNEIIQQVTIQNFREMLVWQPGNSFQVR